MVAAAAVQPVGDAAIARLVLFDVGVEQQQRDAADLRPARRARASSGRRDADPTVTAFPAASRSWVSGRPCGSSPGIVLLLPTVGGQRLHGSTPPGRAARRR